MDDVTKGEGLVTGELLHELFETQAARTPEADALIVGAERLTYRELDSRAEELARHLRWLGVGPETPVGVCMRRSVDLVAGLLGVLKAGGTYVPLDPAYPMERLSFMLEDSRASLLLTQSAIAHRVPATARILCVDVDRAPEAALAGGPGAAGGRPLPGNLAYLIYTSGSTGRPKGVAIEHRSAVGLVRWAAGVFSRAELAGVLASTSVCFDLSVFELFLPLAAGGAVVMAENALQLATLPAAERVTLVNTVPSAITELLRGAGLSASVRVVNLAGEPLKRALVDRIYQVPAVEKVYNLYGPSEDTTYSTFALVPRGSAEAPPIGHAISGTQSHLLHGAVEPAAAGVEGEICLGGHGLARGYLGRPELTAERFVPDPFAGEPGARMYRTGDLGRRRADGGLDFLGRIDHQVKIRGFRIELGEVEAALCAARGVHEAVVVAWVDTEGEKQLVAYVVGEEGRSPRLRELRTALKRRLPDFMVPGRFVPLAAMPLTPNGKVDRKALPDPATVRPDLEDEFVAPRTATEEALAGIWAQLLRLDRVGVHDDLFELGGHSLLATRLISRVRHELGVEVALADVFARPTIAGVAELVAHGGRPAVTPIKPAPRGGDLPVSFAQERVCFIEKLNRDSIAYRFHSTIRFRGRLDVPALHWSLDEIVRRHEIFRTTFPTVDGRPVQRIHPSCLLELPLVDLEPVPAEEREAELERRIAREFRGARFDLTKLPLIQFTLVRLAPEEHLLVHVEHHLVHDGWSYNVLMGELAALYRARVAGAEPDLPELPIQFADFAAWQQEWIAGDEARRQLAYWRDKLAGSPPKLDLPTDFPRPAVQRGRGTAFRIEVPPDLCRDLRAFSRREGRTLFMTLTTAFLALLERYSGQQDICLGSGIANRRWREVEGLIGMIVNTVVLRFDLTGAPTFRELADRVSKVSLESYDNQDLPFEKVVEALQPDRDLSHNPFFQVAFSFHDAPLTDLSLPGLELEIREALSNGSAKFDLNVIVIPRSEQRIGQGGDGNEGMTIVWEFDTDLYRAETMERMVDHYLTLVRGILARPAARFSELPLLTAAEEAELAAWNATAAELPALAAGLPVHELVARQAARAPAALAVAGGGERLTYGELEERANRLAHYLRELGVGPEVPVAVLMERSPEMIVAILGALKAGGAYLPLDPAYPGERLAFLLADSGTPVLLTQERLRGAVPAGDRVTLALDSEWGAVATRSAAPPLSHGRHDLEALAYVIYTSGSTGTPKGVEVPHRGLLNLVGWHQATYGVAPEDRATQLAGPAFDASVWEVWPYLTAGASLHLPDEQTRTAADRLLAWLAAERITMAFLPTPLAEAALAEELPRELALRALLTGGDKLHKAPGRPLPFALVNHYGPTENSVVATSSVVPSGVVTSGAEAPPIGRPIANVRVELLDRTLSRVPVGVPGELCLGGTSLARGYRGRPELTAERFAPDPCGDGGRLYRTGDLARWRPDGELEFLGRIDHQVKVRGFRIELGEIEAVLGSHAAVREAVVLARAVGEGTEKRLVAWVVPAAGALPAPEELAAFLAAKLPEYMVPGAFMVLPALPLTANGKVDRAALPEPDDAAVVRGDGFEAPRTAVEELLAGIWQTLLGVERVGAHDNFFKLGGHSLAATRMLSRLRDAIQIELPLQTLFESPTLEECAVAVEDLLLAEMGELDEGETVEDPVAGELLHELFEAQVARTPDTEALVAGQERLTYRELDRRANRLARHLQRLGIGPETLVGLLLERSADLVVAVLGVLKAGGAFVPLDERAPQERLAFMLEHSGASLVLTQRTLVERLDRVDPLLRRLRIDANREAIARESDERPASAARPENLAYVIYTSGSTGHPKGVLVPHRGLAGVAAGQSTSFGVQPGDRVLQFASWTFDASLFELLLALSAGAALCLAPPEAAVPGRALVELIRRERITHVVLSPSVLSALPDAELPDLRVVIAAAEACPPSLVARWGRGRRFYNGYGPTEATIWSTVAECLEGAGRPPIGRAIASTTVHLVGPDLEPAAEGAAGELLIGGAGLSRGYLRRPDLTAERFLPDPFTAEPGARLYRSGDLARLLPDGQLDFLGRIDHQVKIGGVRIEPGEVEALLDALPEVRGSVVVPREDGAGGRRLVAYLVVAGERPRPEALRDHLRERLPEVMVPSAFVVLDAWPLNPNGKLDHAALPLPGVEQPAAAPELVGPRDPLEEELAGIWRELFGVERPGVHDDLFALGARSLLVVQLAARLRDAFRVELPAREIFDHPTIAGLAGAVERARRARCRSELPAIEPAPRDQQIPLSFTQERVWFLQQLAPSSIAYNAQAALRFSGPLDPEVYARALTEIVRRHEVLRTTFPAVDGRPVQVVHPPFEVALPVVDLTAVPAAEREAATERLIAEEVAQPFDVTALPLVRWKLLRLAPTDHLLVQVEHHFIHDGWSFALLLREMRALYEAFAAGRPSPLPAPPVQYADFAVWQRRWMDGQVLADHLAFWKEKLAGSPPALELPTDRLRPTAQSFRGMARRFHLPADLYRDLRALARREGVTLYMIMLAAFDALLHRYSGQEDLLVGSGVANRRARQIESMVGMVVNTMVFRTSVAGDPTFRELVSRVRATTLEAQAWEDVPFEKVVAEISPDRDLGRNPLFQVMFSFHDAAVPDLEFCGLSGAVRELHNGSAKADLNVVCIPRAEQRFGLAATGEEQLTIIWEHSADLWEAATVDRMIEHYQNLLRAAVADVGLRLSEMAMLSPAEEAELGAWNATAAELPALAAGLPIHELVARQAARTPAALAVAGGGERLTYGELEERANRLAHYLRELGVGPEVPVAVLMERSPEMIVAILGALKAGGAYLPLDPAYPGERLAFLLADSGTPVLLTQERLRGAVPAGDRVTLALDSEWGAVATRSAAPPLSHGRHDLEALAYVIYTSGSTGTPKGVEVPHRGLLNLVGWHQATYGVAPEDRATQLAGPAFDASVWEVWPYLTAGASLHLPDEQTRTAADRLLAWLAAERITMAFLPTPLAEAALAEELPRELALRALLTGGDKLHKAPERPLPFVLVNHYGPTENSVVATSSVVPSGVVTSGAEAPPIGRPIANVRVELLDRTLSRVPVGVPGELCLGGTSLARGYRGRPELTAERFAPDPCGDGGRLYRTGDLARWRPDGELEFLGRIDHQVKVRGFRIELGEIEAVLGSHAAVREAVVLARAVGEGTEKRLVAWVVPATGAAPVPEELAAFLAAKLPEHMVPSAFMVTAALPLTANGKVDRAALPEPDDAAVVRGDGFEAPRTAIEELLAGIWQTLLDVERVGAHDNFFKLGGHSLAATRMLSRLRDAIQIELPLQTLFESPMLDEFAVAVEGLLLAEMGELAESETVAS